eukprot:2574643-Amphidinium_carterae.1
MMLFDDYHGSSEASRQTKVVKLFLELTSQNLHIFAPKVFEFLQSMSAYCASEAYRMGVTLTHNMYLIRTTCGVTTSMLATLSTKGRA